MLTVSAKTESTFEPIPEGTYPAVCCAVIDCGVQYNKQWDNRSRKVAIGWEIPGETYKDKDGVEHQHLHRIPEPQGHSQEGSEGMERQGLHCR